MYTTANAPCFPCARSFSIHATERDGADLKAAQAGLPRPWPTAAPGVYHTGWHSEDTFGEQTDGCTQ